MRTINKCKKCQKYQNPWNNHWTKVDDPEVHEGMERLNSKGIIKLEKVVCPECEVKDG